MKDKVEHGKYLSSKNWKDAQSLSDLVQFAEYIPFLQQDLTSGQINWFMLTFCGRSKIQFMKKSLGCAKIKIWKLQEFEQV